MDIINELKVILESAKAKAERKKAERKASRLTGGDKLAKELGLDFEEGKGWDDYLNDISHFKKLIKKKNTLTKDGKGFSSVISSLNSAINSYNDKESNLYDTSMAKKIEKLRDKLSDLNKRGFFK